jgi:hypothetical protein
MLYCHTARFVCPIGVADIACAGEGLITYMRTDGVNLSAEAVDTLRDLISSEYGSSYLPPAGSRVYKSRAKNAQEAHEAIRPTNPALLPGDVQGLTSDQVCSGDRWLVVCVVPGCMKRSALLWAYARLGSAQVCKP